MSAWGHWNFRRVFSTHLGCHVKMKAAAQNLRGRQQRKEERSSGMKQKSRCNIASKRWQLVLESDVWLFLNTPAPTAAMWRQRMSRWSKKRQEFSRSYEIAEWCRRSSPQDAEMTSTPRKLSHLWPQDKGNEKVVQLKHSLQWSRDKGQWNGCTDEAYTPVV